MYFQYHVVLLVFYSIFHISFISFISLRLSTLCTLTSIFILEFIASRSLQIISWSLQQNIGARDSMKGREHYENVVDRVMQSLQQPCADLRGNDFDSWHMAHLSVYNTIFNNICLISIRTLKFHYVIVHMMETKNI